MKSITRLIAIALALASSTLALAQAMNETAPQPQPAPGAQPSSTPPPPSPNDPSMTTMQQPISGNSTATSPPNSMAPNSAGPSMRLAALLPQGISQKEACEGLKTTHECAAALHASQNLHIPFVDLKAQMVEGRQLDGAIHALKPDADAAAEARRAEQQAHSDLQQSPQG